MNAREGVLNEKATMAAGQEALAEALLPLTCTKPWWNRRAA